MTDRHTRNQTRKRGPAALRRKARRAALQPPTIAIGFDGTVLADALQDVINVLDGRSGKTRMVTDTRAETTDEHTTILDDVMTELHGEDWDR